ncbi:hypothetical protein [Deinococcus humi]|uniref:Transcriptional regulator n=1 Tax=Deinococcus humi TaxID=662880 RepID=A0A7W8NHE1_9DEIO|nr:hypothetical protein [Deinococcus humi]MBB5363902.1 hypothetical protein [Deinococcus humi]GGO31580.1 hypothetical protein GCM10008949_27770 [Deinococcus humi]
MKFLDVVREVREERQELDRLVSGEQNFTRTHMHSLAAHLKLDPQIFL